MSSVCVVVPTLNRPAPVRRCLRALLGGSRLPEQVVVCDQSASLATRQVVEELARELSALEYAHFDSPGASRARNTGLRAARTELVAFIDDDCVPDARWLESLVSRYESAAGQEEEYNGVAAVCGRVLPLANGDSTRGHPVSSRNSIRRRYFRRASPAGGFSGWAPWDAGTGGNMLAPRALLLAVKGFDERLGPGSPAAAAEDIDLLYRLSERGTLIYEPAAVVYHPLQSRSKRLSSRFAYGRGMGSMLGLHLRSGDRSARGLLLLYARHQIANTARHGIWGPLESALTLTGAGAALAKLWLESKMGK